MKKNCHWQESPKNGEKNGFHWPENRLFIENYFLIIKVMVSNSNKIALTKKILFTLGRKFVCAYWIKDIEKYFSMLKISEKIEKNWYELA